MSILSFDWYGYRLLTSYLEDRADDQLQARLDDDRYDESQLLSIKIPATQLAYYNNTTEFERAEGQVEIGGIVYNYVKHRIHNDTLEFLCIPNASVMQLQRAKDDFFQRVNDLRHDGQGRKDSHPGGSKGPFTPDYLLNSDAEANLSIRYIDLPKGDGQLAFLPAVTISPAERPPDIRTIV